MDEETGMMRAHLPHVQTGSMPMSIRLKYPLYRWHSTRYLYEGPQLHQTFADGEWNLKAQGRFAGSGMNCGHYFAHTPEAATAERISYGMFENDALISLSAPLDDVLDLTHGDNIAAIFEKLVELGRMEDNGILQLPWEMVYELMEQKRGGSWITDYIGHWAAEAGYKGILFFSARSAAQYRAHCFERKNKNLGGLDFRENLYAMRLDATSYCAVIFSGATLLPQFRYFAVQHMDFTKRTVDNPVFGWPVDRVRGLSNDFGDVTGRISYRTAPRP
jgi:hypothetical protein